MRITGTITGHPLDLTVQDEYDLKTQIELVHDALEASAIEHSTALRDDIVSRIANGIVTDILVFDDVRLGEVATETATVPNSIPALPEPHEDNHDC